MDAAEKNVLRPLLGGCELRQLEAVADEVGEPNHLISLIVMTEDDQLLSKPELSMVNPGLNRCVGELSVS